MTSQTAFFTILDNEHLIAFQGAENRKFLQGQVTCDVNRLSDGESTLGACCNPKGRIIANFRILALGDDLIMSLPSDQSDYLHTHLKKYAAFFRTVTIADATAQWSRIGVSGSKAAEVIAAITKAELPTAANTSRFADGLIMAIDAERFELWLNPHLMPEHTGAAATTRYLRAHCALATW